MKIYIIKFDWSTTDSGDVELFVYGTYDKAYAKFKELISNELNPDISWVGDIEWNDEGQPIGHYEFEYNDDNSNENEVYWRMTDEWDWYTHTFIDLIIKEIE
ncbi:MAG: hypothetical protein K2M75_04275 [Clostridia bacterium]|nr:hypothetical protein [Clostridia bacterium]